MPLPPALPLLLSLTRTALLVVAPDGGQGVARRNAWAAMSSDAVRARARREATAAMDAADRAHAVRAAHG